MRGFNVNAQLGVYLIKYRLNQNYFTQDLWILI